MLLLCIKFQGRFFSAFDFPNFAIECVGASFFFFPFLFFLFLNKFWKSKICATFWQWNYIFLFIELYAFYFICIFALGFVIQNPAEVSSFSV